MKKKFICGAIALVAVFAAVLTGVLVALDDGDKEEPLDADSPLVQRLAADARVEGFVAEETESMLVESEDGSIFDVSYNYTTAQDGLVNLKGTADWIESVVCSAVSDDESVANIRFRDGISFTNDALQSMFPPNSILVVEYGDFGGCFFDAVDENTTTAELQVDGFLNITSSTMDGGLVHVLGGTASYNSIFHEATFNMTRVEADDVRSRKLQQTVSIGTGVNKFKLDFFDLDIRHAFTDPAFDVQRISYLIIPIIFYAELRVTGFVSVDLELDATLSSKTSFQYAEEFEIGRLPILGLPVFRFATRLVPALEIRADLFLNVELVAKQTGPPFSIKSQYRQSFSRRQVDFLMSTYGSRFEMSDTSGSSVQDLAPSLTSEISPIQGEPIAQSWALTSKFGLEFGVRGLISAGIRAKNGISVEAKARIDPPFRPLSSGDGCDACHAMEVVLAANIGVSEGYAKMAFKYLLEFEFGYTIPFTPGVVVPLEQKCFFPQLEEECEGPTPRPSPYPTFAPTPDPTPFPTPAPLASPPPQDGQNPSEPPDDTTGPPAATPSPIAPPAGPDQNPNEPPATGPPAAAPSPIAPPAGPTLIPQTLSPVDPNLNFQFWVAEMDKGSETCQSSELGISVANPSSGNARVLIRNQGTMEMTELTVAPGGVETTRFPCRFSNHGSALQVLMDTVYLVASDVEVSVIAFDPISSGATNDATLILPASVLGTSHRIVGFGGDAADANLIAVVATQDETTVQIRNGFGFNVASETLQQGEMIIGLSGADTSGWSVEASNPVAVFAGNRCASVGNSTNFCDFLYTQVLPINQLSSNYVLCPTRARPLDCGGDLACSSDRFRITATQASTLLEIQIPGRDEPVTDTIGAGQGRFYDQSQPHTLVASNPVYVYQMLSSEQAGAPAPGIGDPSLIALPPVARYRNEYTFYIPDSFTHDFVAAAIPTTTALMLDGAAVAEPCVSAGTVGGVEYCCVTVSVSDGAHSLSGDEPFGLLAFGFGAGSSYAYSAG